MNSEMLKESGEQENIGGASLGKLVARIESYPFSDQDRFGAVFNGEDEIVAGFRPENLVKGLKRWNAQLKDGKDLPIDKLYKNRLELAAIEASFKMAGQLDPRVGSKIRERAQELRQIIGKGKLIERGSLPEFPTAKIDFQSKKVPKLTKVEVLKNQATLVKRRVGEARERLAPFRGLDSFREVAGKLSESYRLGGDFFEQRNIQARSTEDQSLLQVATWLRTNSLRKGQLPRMERVRVVGKSGRVVEFDPNLTRSPKDSKEAVTISEAVLGLAEMRAKLEVISANVPDAYAGLQMGVRRTMKLVDNATLNLVDGKLGLSGRFSLEQVLRTSAERKRRDLRMKTTEGVLILALAACAVPGVGTSTPVSPEVTPVKTEQVLVRSSIENAEIDSSIAESRAIENPTAEDIENLEKLLNLRKGLEQITNAVPGWESVAPEQMQFAIMTVYDASGRVTGGFELVKNIETKEQMVLSVGEKVEEDETVLRKYVNLPLYERFTIDSEGRFVNGDWYYVDAEGNKHSLYKTNEEGKLGGVPIEGEIIWSEQVLGYQPINTLETAKLAKIALPPGDLTGLTIDTELGQMTNSEGMLMSICIEGGKNFVEVPQVLRELSIKLPKESRIEVDLNDVFSIIMKINDEYYIAGDIDLEANQMNIVTAKNEPYKIDLGQLIAKKNDLVILDKDGQQLLEFTDVGWEADKLLFLLAPEPNNGYSYSKDLLPTSMGNREMTSVFINVTEGGSVNVGFYDNLGVLHPYILGLENNSTVVGICETTSANGDQFCRIYTPSEAVEVLKSWYKESMPRLLSFDLLERDSVTEELIAALKAGEGFPIPSDGYKIPVNTIRER